MNPNRNDAQPDLRETSRYWLSLSDGPKVIHTKNDGWIIIAFPGLFPEPVTPHPNPIQITQKGKSHMNTLRNIIFVALALILVAGLAACVPNRTENRVEYTEEKVTGIVESMLNGYNVGDYAAFSQYMAQEMKLFVSEKLFNDFVRESSAMIGKFQSITSIEEGNSDSLSSHWLVTAQFDHGAQAFEIVFEKGNGRITGLDFGPQE